MEINDVSALILQKSLGISSKEIETSLASLSYGEKTKAVEDAANMMISESMDSQRRGEIEAAENAQMGMNMLATADSGLSSINENLQRIRELSLQKENGTYSDADKYAMDSEIDALTEEIDRVSETTSFNKINLLDGSSSDTVLQTGANAGNSISTGNSFKKVDSSTLELDKSAPDFVNKVDKAIEAVTKQRSEVGSYQNRLEGTVNAIFTKQENLSASLSSIKDVDVAAEASKLAQNQILQSASVSLFAQANQSPSIAAILV